jgi:hypothetical protein
MIPRYRILAQRIEQEVLDLERTVATIQRHWAKAETSATDQDAYLNSVALSLHGFYSGLERIFELIAVELDGGTLGRDAWHAELLRQMALDVPDVRPAALRPETVVALDELRRFRHRVCNIYATSLDPARIQPLVAGLPTLWEHLQQDIAAFVSFLRRLARADPEP